MPSFHFLFLFHTLSVLCFTTSPPPFPPLSSILLVLIHVLQLSRSRRLGVPRQHVVQRVVVVMVHSSRWPWRPQCQGTARDVHSWVVVVVRRWTRGRRGRLLVEGRGQRVGQAQVDRADDVVEELLAVLMVVVEGVVRAVVAGL